MHASSHCTSVHELSQRRLSGVGRCDFPGGGAHILYQSIQKLLPLPLKTRMFICHEYLPNAISSYHRQKVDREALYTGRDR